MKIEKKLYCHWDLVKFITEEHLIREDETLSTLSVIDGKDTELMIFLGKDESNNDYEVRVYKYSANDKYIPNKNDNIKGYEENDEYATFFFEEFEEAQQFVDYLGYVHKEYKIRPIRKIEN